MVRNITKRQAIIISIVYVFLFIVIGLLAEKHNAKFTVGSMLLIIGNIIGEIFLVSSFLRIEGKGRYFWLLIMLSGISQFAASIALAYYMLFVKKDMVHPSVVDILYYFSLVLYFLAIIYKAYEKKSYYKVREIFFDSGIMIVVATTLSYIFIIKPVINSGEPLVVSIAYLQYPIMQVANLVGIISLMFSDKPALPQRVLLLNFMGVVLYVVANSVYFYDLAKAVEPPNYVFLFWLLNPILMGISSLFDEGEDSWGINEELSKIQRIERIAFPYMALVILFIVGIVKNNEITTLFFGGAAGVVLVSIRQGFVIADNRRLVAEFKELNNVLELKVKERTSELDMKSREFEFEANHDSLTGLPNRRVFTREFGDAIKEVKLKKKQLALLYLDLDSFKNINDLMGHSAGDGLLIEVSKRFLSCLGNKYSVYRLGGDEFAVVIKNVENLRTVKKVSEMIHKSLKKEIVINDNAVKVTSSVGIAVYPHNGNTVDSLMSSADIAMYYSKAKGRGISEFYNSTMHDYTIKRMDMSNEMNKALQNNEFVIYYQPQYDSIKDSIYGAEALLRWKSPIFGMVSPAEFIPIAEESGLIVEIGEWVLRQACIQARVWNSMASNEVKIGVNISLRQFTQDNFLESVKNVLRETGLEPRLLDLEITETIAMHSEKYVINKLKKLRNLGVSISIDDFGTGHSSLSYLKDLPVDTMKIAMPFVRAIQLDTRDKSIVDLIISMARNLNLNVIAEGVETKEQLELLKGMGCKNIQGYYIAKPLPPGEFEKTFLSNMPGAEACAAAAKME